MLLRLVQAAELAAVPLLLAWLRQHLTLMQGATLVRTVTDFVSRSAGLTYQVLASACGSVGSVTLTNTAVAHGLQYVMQSMPDALKRLGVTPDHVGTMVTAELGKLLAVDPNVSIAPPVSPASPTASPTAAAQAA